MNLRESCTTVLLWLYRHCTTVTDTLSVVFAWILLSFFWWTCVIFSLFCGCEPAGVLLRAPRRRLHSFWRLLLTFWGRYCHRTVALWLDGNGCSPTDTRCRLVDDIYSHDLESQARLYSLLCPRYGFFLSITAKFSSFLAASAIRPLRPTLRLRFSALPIPRFASPTRLVAALSYRDERVAWTGCRFRGTVMVSYKWPGQARCPFT